MNPELKEELIRLAYFGGGIVIGFMLPFAFAVIAGAMDGDRLTPEQLKKIEEYNEAHPE